jgi:membrane associated rhomboid family serine protease
MRGEEGPMSVQFPRPGPVLKAVLIALVSIGLGGAILQWTAWGGVVFQALMFIPERVLHRYEVWRFVTSGLLTLSFSQLLSYGIGLYFLSPDLERRWGSKRFAWFLAGSIVAGNVLVLVVNALPLTSKIFHPDFACGCAAAMAAIAVAWAQANPELEVRLFFFLPIKGKYLFWITLVFCLIPLVYGDPSTDGVAAPFGGILTGMAFGGSTSILRRSYLELKLALLKRRAASGAGGPGRPSVRRARSGGPALRVLPGGLEEELKKREPPNDKRYLN